MKHIAEDHLAIIMRDKFLFERYGLSKWMSLVQAYTYYLEVMKRDVFIVDYDPMSKDSFATIMGKWNTEKDWLSKEKRKILLKGVHRTYVFYSVVNPADINKDKGTWRQKAAKLFNWKSDHNYAI